MPTRVGFDSVRSSNSTRLSRSLAMAADRRLGVRSDVTRVENTVRQLALVGPGAVVSETGEPRVPNPESRTFRIQ